MPRRHVVLALVVAVVWAVNFVVIDSGLESFPPLLFAALRFGLTAFPAIFFVPRPDVRWRAVVAVGLFIGVGQFGVLFVAMNTGLPAGLASVIAPLKPVFTIPFAVIALGERPSLRQVIGVSLAIAGLGAIAVARARGVPLQAVALGVASAASWGCGNVVTRAAKPKRPFSLLVWSSVVAPLPAARAVADLRGHWPLAERGVFGRCVRPRRPRLRRRRLDLFRLRQLVLADVALPGVYRCSLHASRAGRRDRHRVARARGASDLGRTARVSGRLGRPWASAWGSAWGRRRKPSTLSARRRQAPLRTSPRQHCRPGLSRPSFSLANAKA